MDNQNQNIIIAVAFAAVLVIGFFSLFEYRDVPNTKWSKTYEYDSKEPYGAYVFKELLADAVGPDHLHIITPDDDQMAKVDSHQLYIMLAHYARIDSTKSALIDTILSRDGDVLFISNYILGTDQTLKEPFSYYGFTMNDSTTIWHSGLDTTVYYFAHREKSLEDSTVSTIIYFQEDLFNSLDYYQLAESIDSQSIFIRKCLDQGRLYYYSIPYHFSNVASESEAYLDNFNQVFSHFSPSSIIIDSPSPAELIRISNRGRGYGGYEDFESLEHDSGFASDNNSPIQYILSQPPLSWAYYLTLLALILFALFRGKRKQRIIPIAEKNENTSLEYVDTISHLFQAQHQNSKLVAHIEDIFHQKVKKKYFIDKQHHSYVAALSKKAKVKEKEIEIILNIFQNAGDGYAFSDDQLHQLHNRLESFYHNWK